MLVKQDKFEAENTVKGRLEFIGKEMYAISFSTFFFLFLFSPLRLTLLTLMVVTERRKTSRISKRRLTPREGS